MQQKITTFLTFNNQAEEAAKLYTSLFKDSKVLSTHKYGPGGRMPEGTVMIVEFQLAGQKYTALNGGPDFRFAEGMSLFVSCDDRAEVDRLWDTLSDGGQKQMCGWLQDRFGVSWQIIPKALMELMGDPDPKKAGRVMEAMLKMQKIDVKALQKAYDNG
ncbi:MAG: VOC family protein [SAR202 cluster bacterium]|nr:VOC family protein [SAR202 cluster bacterium]